MKSSREAARGASVLAGMEGLILAMKGKRRVPAVAEPVIGAIAEAGEEDEDELAAAVWKAMNLPLPTGTDGEPCDAGGGWAYLERGAVVGRYVVLRELGAGGMGVVYAAYDPELDRKVALKLVLPGKAGGEERTRLLREAQALAKLSHRSVVGIHDVGTMGEQVWLAMEFVRGQTLGEWLKQPRDWREVLGVMRKAGRGLAAAHAVGLLHRDFKPENVMVGKGGRVRVMDFGLARARPNVVPMAADESTHEMPVLDTLAMRVTQAGTLVGTPLYMAPEQFLGRELTAAVDQFALCVTLWEGLYGERPFVGETLDERVDNMLAGRVREPAKGRGVPGWLRRVCERGMSAEPQRRFESMEVLLDTLTKGRMRARIRKGLAAVGVLAVLGLGAEGYRRFDIMQRTAACEASGDEVEVAWNVERKQKLHDALVATGVSYAPTTAEKVMPWLDKQAEAWREARVEACLDTDVRGQWDAETLDRSLWCLDERRTQLESLVNELTLADAGVLQKAVPAAAGLASVAPCRDESVLEALVPPPDEDREAVRAVRAIVTRAGNLERAGRYIAGLELARGALEQAEGLQWRPLSAAARLRLGSLLEATGAYTEGERVSEDAYFEAADGVAPEVAVEAATDLVWVTGVDLMRHAEGQRWGRHAQVTLASVRDEERLHDARLLNNLATVHEATGAHNVARALYTRAHAIWVAALGPHHPEVAAGLNNLAKVHHATGSYEDAAELQERALAILEQALGPDHPDVAVGLANLATVYDTTGAHDEAKIRHERALAIRENALGPDHPQVADSLNNLAIHHRATGNYIEAKTFHERALAVRERVLGPDHPDVANSLSNLANVNRDLGGYDEAKVLHERALAILEKVLGPDHPDVANSLSNLAIDHRETGDYDEAKALHERVLAIREKTLSPEHPDVASSLDNLAIVYGVTGDYDEAKALHERALAIREKALGSEHPAVAVSLNNLAAAHEATGGLDEAKLLYERALAIREKVLGPNHPNVAISLTNLAYAYEVTGAYDEAKPLYARALAIREKVLGLEHPDTAYSLLGLAEIALCQHRPTDAIPLAQRAATVREKGGVAANLLAEARFVLARALWEAPVGEGRDRARAVPLAQQARNAFRYAGEGRATDLADVEQWIRDHGDGR
jgi:eukaryotic-like serine/threonine-protein kinase